LADAGLKVNILLVDVDDQAQVDRVVGQVPQSGAMVLSGSTVTINVGR
jgi:beta-lactam-binding protein with PASTA domain